MRLEIYNIFYLTITVEERTYRQVLVLDDFEDQTTT